MFYVVGIFSLSMTAFSILSFPVGDAREAGIRPGDRLLEVNGFSVRGVGHKEAGKLIAEGSDNVTILVHTVKPAPTPDGE